MRAVHRLQVHLSLFGDRFRGVSDGVAQQWGGVVFYITTTIQSYIPTHLRVPVRIVDDDRVGGGEVDAEAARARREDEDELGRVGGVEHLDCWVEGYV